MALGAKGEQAPQTISADKSKQLGENKSSERRAPKRSSDLMKGVSEQMTAGRQAFIWWLLNCDSSSQLWCGRGHSRYSPGVSMWLWSRKGMSNCWVSVRKLTLEPTSFYTDYWHTDSTFNLHAKRNHGELHLSVEDHIAKLPAGNTIWMLGYVMETIFNKTLFQQMPLWFLCIIE